mgnify:FL=1|jgi:N-acetyl-anhydromuramyl-L-alanine amidase AmpD
MTTTFKEPLIDYHRNFVKFKSRSSTDYLVVHCSATQNKPEYTWKTIDQMHRQRGWLGIGYHFVILTDGTIQNGRPLEAIGSHVLGYNDDSVGICLIGGTDRNGKSVDNFTEKQKESLKKLLDWLKSKYPKAKVLGHRDFPGVAKDCPCFDVQSWYGRGAVYVTYEDASSLDRCKLSQADLKEANGTLEFTKGDLVRIA